MVLFLGVLYHLRHPLLALERVAGVTGDLLILETEVDLALARRPAMAFYPGEELSDDWTNWWGRTPPPSWQCYERWASPRSMWCPRTRCPTARRVRRGAWRHRCETAIRIRWPPPSGAASRFTHGASGAQPASAATASVRSCSPESAAAPPPSPSPSRGGGGSPVAHSSSKSTFHLPGASSRGVIFSFARKLRPGTPLESGDLLGRATDSWLVAAFERRLERLHQLLGHRHGQVLARLLLPDHEATAGVVL